LDNPGALFLNALVGTFFVSIMSINVMAIIQRFDGMSYSSDAQN
jgi:hypothetical protein